MSEELQTTVLELNAKDFGLDTTKAEQLEKVFSPMRKAFEELDAEYKEILSSEKITPELCEKAAILRKRYVKVRTGAEAAHKVAKANVLLEGRAIDGLKNIVAYATTENEQNLRKVEEHFERIERERIEAKVEERTAELVACGVDVTFLKLEQMNDEVYEQFLKGSKAGFEQRKADEKKEEEERLKKEKQREVEEAEMRKENVRLKKEQEERDEIEAKKEEKRQAELAKERKANEEKLEKERKANEAKLEKERREREKVEAELKVRQDAELKADEEKQRKEEEKVEAERAALLAPDKDKLLELAKQLLAIQLPVLKNQNAQRISKGVQTMLGKMVSYINDNIEKL